MTQKCGPKDVEQRYQLGTISYIYYQRKAFRVLDLLKSWVCSEFCLINLESCNLWNSCSRPLLCERKDKTMQLRFVIRRDITSKQLPMIICSKYVFTSFFLDLRSCIRYYINTCFSFILWQRARPVCVRKPFFKWQLVKTQKSNWIKLDRDISWIWIRIFNSG